MCKEEVQPLRTVNTDGILSSFASKVGKIVIAVSNILTRQARVSGSIWIPFSVIFSKGGGSGPLEDASDCTGHDSSVTGIEEFDGASNGGNVLCSVIRN